jgi:hypothetical protein
MDPASGGNSPTRHVLRWAIIGFVPRTPPLISVQLCPLGFGLLTQDSYLVDSASSHMLVSKIKPCMSKYKQSIR